MIVKIRERIARVLALFVFVVSFGRVEVNPTGHATASDARGKESHIAARPRA
ncbi:MAG: hypothetical protein IT381_07805 [Deltaproteobacteria bacterium]|nr:hypothetical protein [Deltaproteobacteria bacterium]